MKKILVGLLTVLTIFLIVGCESNKDIKKTSQEDKDNKSVVVYFSATNNTKNIAEQIKELSKSDIIEIIPKEKYTSEDLNYNGDCRANREQNDSSSRPEIENKIDISRYDTIYLGYPIWWGTYPKIILTLLDTYDFNGKTIIPFCTSGSTDIKKSVENLRKYNDNLNIKDGKRFSINASEEEIRKFIDENNKESKE